MNPHLKDWIPYKLVHIEEVLWVEWIYLGDIRLVHPFFEESIAKCKSHALNSQAFKAISHIDLLLDWQDTITHTETAAFIFHISRCGSTMLSQLLSLSEQHIVVAEAPVLDQVLQCQEIDQNSKKRLFAAVLHFLGQKRFEAETQVVVKLDSWHFHYIDLLREMYPEVPFLILVRNPEEVLQSHLKHRGIHMVPNLLPLYLFDLDEEAQTFHEYSVAVLKSYFKSIYTFHTKDNASIICDYKYGVEAMILAFEKLTGQRFSESIHGQMKERLQRHSKNSSETFTGDQYTTSIHMDVVYENLMGQYGQVALEAGNVDIKFDAV
jgi:hypothetical protein